LATKHLDRGSFALRFLIAGLFGCPLLGVTQAFAQALSAGERVDEGLSLRFSDELLPAARPLTRNARSGKASTEFDAPLRLAPSLALGAQVAAGTALSSRRDLRTGRGNAPLLLADAAADDPPYDPTDSSAPAVIRPGRPLTGSTKKAPGAIDTADVTQGDSDGSGLGWGLAPLRWGGQLGVLTRRNSSSDGGRSSDMQEYLNLRAASYVYQPWFAQVNGNLQLATNQGSSTGGSDGTESRQQGKSITGGGSLRLFPISRFPFQANFDVSDSRNNSDLVSTDYTNTRLGVRQNYQPEDGAYAVSGGYDSSTINSNGFGKDSVGTWFGNFSRNTDVQSMQGNLNYSESTRTQNGDASRLLTFDSRHTYRIEENISYDSLAMITDNTLNYTTPAGVSSNHGRYMQFNSTLTWRPEDEDIPLYVIGGLRTLSALNETNGASSTSQSMGLNLSATYTPTANLSLSGNGLLTRVANNLGGAQLLSLVGGGATYSGDPLNFGNYSYNWSAGASGSQQSGGGGQGTTSLSSNTSLTGQFNHNLNRAILAGEGSSWYLTLGQSLAETSSSQVGNTASLTNSAGVSYRAIAGEAYSGTASFNANDMLTTGANAGHFRYFNVQLNGQAQFSQRSSGSVNLTFQWSAQETPQVQSNAIYFNGVAQNNGAQQSTSNVFGSAVFQHQRAFGMPGLRYTMSFNANTLARDDRLAGDVNGSVERLTYSLDNRFDYRIGMLDFQLKGLITESAGKKNALIFLKATRDFGRY
jgi:hypothetical protein